MYLQSSAMKNAISVPVVRADLIQSMTHLSRGEFNIEKLELYLANEEPELKTTIRTLVRAQIRGKKI